MCRYRFRHVELFTSLAFHVSTQHKPLADGAFGNQELVVLGTTALDKALTIQVQDRFVDVTDAENHANYIAKPPRLWR